MCDTMKINRPRTVRQKPIINVATISKRSYKKIMPQVSLGKIPGGYKSNLSLVSKDKLRDFVYNEIQYGPQIVSLQIPPERHAFLVDIIENTKIMISDWSGSENETAGLKKINGKKNTEYKPEWSQYSEFMQLLQEKYSLPLSFYPIDEELQTVSMQKSNAVGGGGCSDYIFKWANQYYPEYI